MIGEKCPMAFEEVQQIRHLFEIGGNIGVVSAKMDVVELNIDDVLDAVPEVTLRPRRLAETAGKQCSGSEKT